MEWEDELKKKYGLGFGDWDSLIKDINSLLKEQRENTKALIDGMVEKTATSLKDFLWEEDIIDEMQEKILKMIRDECINTLTKLRSKLK